jgi:hypothetical protein
MRPHGLGQIGLKATTGIEPVDGFAVRRKALLSAYLSGFQGSRVLSGTLKKRSVGESFGRVPDKPLRAAIRDQGGRPGPNRGLRPSR